MFHCGVDGTFQLTMENVVHHSTRPGEQVAPFDIRQSAAFICLCNLIVLLSP